MECVSIFIILKIERREGEGRMGGVEGMGRKKEEDEGGRGVHVVSPPPTSPRSLDRNTHSLCFYSNYQNLVLKQIVRQFMNLVEIAYKIFKIL